MYTKMLTRMFTPETIETITRPWSLLA